MRKKPIPIGSNMKISELLSLYKSDKVDPHTYGEAYDELFNEFDRQGNLNILEIGTQKGGSLCAWQDFFPNAKVTGLDIVDVVEPEYRREGINYVLCDVKEYKTDEMFDIVIDDGSHWLKDVVHSVGYFSKKLKIGGMMIIEDVQNEKVWYQTIATVIHPTLGYNKGYKWEFLLYNDWKDKLEDNVMFALKRTV